VSMSSRFRVFKMADKTPVKTLPLLYQVVNAFADVVIQMSKAIRLIYLEKKQRLKNS